MKPSPKCEAFVKDFEKCRLKAYLPTPNDVPTIGWGSTGPDIKLGMTWTQEQADARFTADLARFARKVSEAIGDTPTTQGEYDAMVSLAYNIGVAAFTRSTLARQHRDGNKKSAAEQFLRWVRQGSKVLPGLVRRRAAERLMYLGNLS